VLASRKLGRKDAAEIAKRASAVFVAKGKKVSAFKPAGKAGKAGKELLDAMLGPTGNLRAPTIRRGKTVLVGFNEELFAEKLG
jgi:arsenate reductase-like glutaredoxin family protein